MNTKTGNINIVIDEDDENVVSINSDQDIEKALNSRDRVPTPVLIMDLSGNNTD